MFYRDTLVGTDSLGNRYYRKGAKRFVQYASKECDPTAISKDWYLWLHHAVDSPENSFSPEVNPCSVDSNKRLEKDEVCTTYVPWRPE